MQQSSKQWGQLKFPENVTIYRLRRTLQMNTGSHAPTQLHDADDAGDADDVDDAIADDDAGDDDADGDAVQSCNNIC